MNQEDALRAIKKLQERFRQRERLHRSIMRIDPNEVNAALLAEARHVNSELSFYADHGDPAVTVAQVTAAECDRNRAIDKAFSWLGARHKKLTKRKADGDNYTTDVPRLEECELTIEVLNQIFLDGWGKYE